MQHFQAKQLSKHLKSEDSDNAVIIIIFMWVMSKDYVDGVDGVDHREGCKGDDEGVGRVMVDNGGTPRVDNQLKISKCESRQKLKTYRSPIVAFLHQLDETVSHRLNLGKPSLKK